MESITTFLYSYLEYVVGGIGGVGFMGYMLTRKHKDCGDDTTQYLIKIKKHQDYLNKQGKS